VEVFAVTDHMELLTTLLTIFIASRGGLAILHFSCNLRDRYPPDADTHSWEVKELFALTPFTYDTYEGPNDLGEETF
jgi:hypothetical protein